jgi:D-beta-D-heptose 7-phosphate kinase/D-beta-D-heptose 1-phosphate adenosyltransferase
MLDRYWHGASTRLSPEAPVPIVKVEQCIERPGGAGNVAANIASLGAKATLLGVVGDDAAAESLEKSLRSVGVELLLQRIEDVETIIKLRVLSQHQQLIRLDFEAGVPQPDSSVLLERYRQALVNHDVVVLSDYGKGTLNAPAEFLRLAKEAGKPVVVDPKGSDFERYRGADFVTPNLKEFEAVVGPCVEVETLEMKALELAKRCEIGALLVTRGENGMSLLRPGNEAVHLAARAQEVYDVTGAGDTVCATLAAALGSGYDSVTATELANTAAGLSVAKLGAAVIARAELEMAWDGDSVAESGVLGEDELLEAVRTARARGERLVMTNGCFDLLHSGHVSYLSEARVLADRLIVAINDDASVTRLKGAGRPVTPLAARAQVLSALTAVDWVIAFSEDTPERIIAAVAPDILVKGGDYRPEQIAGGDDVKRAGGEVKVLAYHDGWSTSDLIERMVDGVVEQKRKA